MSEDPKPSEELLELIFTALDHGVLSIDEGAGPPLVPFVLYADGDKLLIERFAAEDVSDGTAQAQTAAADMAARGIAVAVAFDTYITLPDTGKTDAICVKAAEGADGPTFTFCQRYRVINEGKNVERIEDPAYLDVEDGVVF